MILSIQPICLNHQGTRRLFLFIAELTLCKTRAINPPVTLPWQLRTNRKTRCLAVAEHLNLGERREVGEWDNGYLCETRTITPPIVINCLRLTPVRISILSKIPPFLLVLKFSKALWPWCTWVFCRDSLSRSNQLCMDISTLAKKWDGHPLPT